MDGPQVRLCAAKKYYVWSALEREISPRRFTKLIVRKKAVRNLKQFEILLQRFASLAREQHQHMSAMLGVLRNIFHWQLFDM